MESARNILMFMFVVLVFTFCISWGGMQQKSGDPFSFQTQAFAAENTEADEPFEEEHIATLDPLEPMNRAFFQFNDKLYFWFLKPVGTFYGKVIPQGIRIDISNAYENIQFPIRFVNNGLQGKFKGSGVEFARFVINSTLGFGGTIDIANRHFGLQPYDEDFGQTLGYYGMKPIVFINLPFLGPSTARDTLGTAADSFLNPLFYLSPDIAVSAGVKGGTILNKTSLRLGVYEDFKDSALDPYVAMRDFYLNYRAKEIRK